MWTDNDDRIMQLIVDVKGNQLFPEKCPVCGKQAAHIYMHRHKDDRGGVWAWCSQCHSFTHLFSAIPKWWVNFSEIDVEQLCAKPQYLDEHAYSIDQWVNTLRTTGSTLSK